jgi:hypothetical protein
MAEDPYVYPGTGVLRNNLGNIAGYAQGIFGPGAGALGGLLYLEAAPEHHPCDCLVIRVLEIKHLNLTTAHPGFIFNSTNCNKRAITSNVFSGVSKSRSGTSHPSESKTEKEESAFPRTAPALP